MGNINLTKKSNNNMQRNNNKKGLGMGMMGNLGVIQDLMDDYESFGGPLNQANLPKITTTKTPQQIRKAPFNPPKQTVQKSTNNRAPVPASNNRNKNITNTTKAPTNNRMNNNNIKPANNN